MPGYAKRLPQLVLAIAMLVSLAPSIAAADPISSDPLSSMVAVSFVDDNGTGAENGADYVKALVAQYAAGETPEGMQFPLINASTDSVRALGGFSTNVVVRWLDPLTWDASVEGPRFGANADYIAYFGDGWGEEKGLASVYKGSDTSGWVWVNHEYISNAMPTLTSAPTGQHRTFARFLSDLGVLTNDVHADEWSQEAIDRYIAEYKRQVGGSWFRIVQDPSSGAWQVDRSAANLRYDATSNTLSTVTGFELSGIDQNDFTGEALPAGVVSGIMGDCSGGQTPWGTIITAEENVQYYYGDLEACWTSRNMFVAEAGFDAGGRISPVFSPAEGAQFTLSSDSAQSHRRDAYGFLAEIQPGAAANDYYESVASGGDGKGHRKIGAMGRARWENASFHVGPDWELVAGQPLVVYAANDRYSGRIYKFVSAGNYEAGMSQGEVRALLDGGTLYVSHLAGLDYDTGYTVGGAVPTEGSPGTGEWIEMSIDSEDVAPNAATLGEGTTVGEALQDPEWNKIGAFASDNDVLMALFTAANKIGAAEQNRPEDVEWNPLDPSGTPRLYVAFTKHTRTVALDENGVVYDPEVHAEQSAQREDRTGSIFVIEEADPANPGSSKTFRYFAAWVGTQGTGAFDVANPDNLMIDADGGVWFGTDGNFGTNSTADALYYLDLDPGHQDGEEGITNPTFGKAFRVVAGPSDSETTGPAFSADMGSIFFNVQHPGERVFSSWPNDR